MRGGTEEAARARITMTPSAQTERIRDASNIVAVVGEYVKLRKSGQNYTGLCPFHHEKTPSFVVSEPKQLFHCKGCAAGGDVFTFVRQIEGVSFPAARKALAERSGITLDDRPVDPATWRRQRAYAEQLAAETAWFWRRMRQWLIGQENATLAILRRAEAWLAARVDAPDSPGMEYAWWWVVDGPRIAARWRLYVDHIDDMKPSELLAGYTEIRRTMPGLTARYREYVKFCEAEQKVWAGILGAAGAAAVDVPYV